VTFTVAASPMPLNIAVIAGSAATGSLVCAAAT